MKDKQLMLDMHEIRADVFEHPFPLSKDSQIKLLELIRRRKSGIISRSELIKILFPTIDKPAY